MNSFLTGAEVRVAEEEDLWQVRELAQKIFPETYREIVDGRQIDFMMDLFYTPEALVTHLNAGQIFLILYFESIPSGYASFTPFSQQGFFKLNKIYVDHSLKGKGLGRFLLLEVLLRVKAAGGHTLQLNVNRLNTATGFYRKMGFVVVKEELLDIGDGYFMDDFVMELKLTPAG